MKTVVMLEIGIYLPGKRDMVYDRIDTSLSQFEGVSVETHRFGIKVTLGKQYTLVPWNNVKWLSSEGELKP